MLKFEMSNIHELFDDDDEEWTEITPQTVTDKKDKSKKEIFFEYFWFQWFKTLVSYTPKKIKV